MIQFEKAQTFVNRTIITSMLIHSDPLRQALMDEKIGFIKEEQKVIEFLFKEFKSEISTNLELLLREQHKAYLLQVRSLFSVDISWFDAVDSLTLQLFSKHGVNYQYAAWDTLQDELKTHSLTIENKTRFTYLILISTGGAAYYKYAFNLIEIQINASLETESVAQFPNIHTKEFIKSDKAKIKLRVVALLYSYEEVIIPKKASTANNIAHQYGHKSGASLYKQYCKVSKRINRVGVDGKALIPMIEDIEAVLPLLSDTAKQKATDELRTLEAKK